MVRTGGERRKGGCRKEWKVFAGAEVYGGIEKNGQRGGWERGQWPGSCDPHIGIPSGGWAGAW